VATSVEVPISVSSSWKKSTPFFWLVVALEVVAVDDTVVAALDVADGLPQPTRAVAAKTNKTNDVFFIQLFPPMYELFWIQSQDVAFWCFSRDIRFSYGNPKGYFHSFHYETNKRFCFFLQ